MLVLLSTGCCFVSFHSTDKPECHTSLTTYFIYDKIINVTCNLTSHPPVTSIQWQWKNTDDVIDTDPITEQGEWSSAMLKVDPFPGGEDRTLSCWGVNAMGKQEHPCKFSIKGDYLSILTFIGWERFYDYIAESILWNLLIYLFIF